MKFAALFPLLALLGCGPTHQPLDDPDELTPDQALRELSRATGAPWQARFDPVLGTAAFLSGRSAPIATPDRLASASRAFLLRHRALFGLSQDDDDLVHVSTVRDGLDASHVRFAQARSKIPIWGSSLTLHLDAHGAARRVHARALPVRRLRADDLPTDPPALSKEAARQLVLDRLHDELPEAMLGAATPQLFYLPDPDQGALWLTYRVEVEGQLGALPLRREIFLAAEPDGALRQVTDLMAPLSLSLAVRGSGVGTSGERRALDVTQRGATYYLEDTGRGGGKTLGLRPNERIPGRTVSSKAADRWEDEGAGAGHAVDVHAHLATIWDYFAREHGRFGPAGDGRGAVAVVHVGDRLPLALYDGRRLLFGDGDGAAYRPLGAALDVVAHEYMHAVVRNQIKLTPRGESAAVDEGIADLFACLIEEAALGDRSDWTIGESIRRSGPLRDLRVSPSSDLPAIRAAIRDSLSSDAEDQERGRAAGAQLIGHAGYTIATRIGRAKTAAIFYRAITTYLHQSPGFSDLADASLAAVQDLHGGDAAEGREVAAAWRLLEVPSVAEPGAAQRP